MDRIAEAAQASKGLIYAYYGNKEQLFDTVLTQRVNAVFDAVPFTTADLSSFAGTLFDHLLTSPKLLRLHTWRHLERGDSPAVEIEWGREKIEALARAQKHGVITTELEPAGLLTMVPGIVTSWFHVSPCRIRPPRTPGPRNACNSTAQPSPQPYAASSPHRRTVSPTGTGIASPPRRRTNQ